MQILVVAVERSLPLSKSPSSSVKEPGCEQRCRRDTSRVRPVHTLIVCFLCRPDLSFHHGKYVRALYAEYEACFLTRITEVLGFLAVIRLDSPHNLDEVAGDVAVTLLVMLESPIFAVLELGSRTLCLAQ